MGHLSAGWWGWDGGGFPLESPSLPLQNDTLCPPHAYTFTVLLPLLPGSWPGRIWAPPPLSHSQEGGDGGKVAGIPHLLLGGQ